MNPFLVLLALVSQTEVEYRIPSGLLHAVISQESGYRVGAINDRVATHSYGLGQLTYWTAKIKCGLSMREIFDPRKNVRCAAKVLRYQIDRYRGDIRFALAAYNVGTACVCIKGVFRNPEDWRVCKFLAPQKQGCSKPGLILNRGYVNGVLAKRGSND